MANKGREFEKEVAKITRQKMGKGQRDNKSGANWFRKADIITPNLPLFIEAKDHATLKMKEWYRQAREGASPTETPVVVYRQDGDVMAAIKYEDLLDLFVQIADQSAEINQLRKPMTVEIPQDPYQVPRKPVVPEGYKGEVSICGNGHLSDKNGYCQQRDCKYSRTYRKPKAKKI